MAGAGSRDRTGTKSPRNSVTFTLPLPPSVNVIYEVRNGQIKIKPKWLYWRSQQVPRVQVLDIGPCSVVRIDMWFFYNWYTSDGELRQFDSLNLQKFTVDTCAYKQEWDDKVAKFGYLGSVHSEEKSQVRVRMVELPGVLKPAR